MSSILTDLTRLPSSGRTESTRAQPVRSERAAPAGGVAETAGSEAYWSIATTVKSSSISLSSAEDAQALSAALTDKASVALDAATEVMSDIQSKLYLAKTPGVDKDGVNSALSDLKGRLLDIAQAGSFQGQNWLQSETGKVPKVQSIVGSVSSDRNGDVAINIIDFDTAKSTLVAKEDASDGLLTRSYSGITRSGAPYDYHLLEAGAQIAVPPSSREISVSRSVGNDEIEGMLSAVGSMMRGLTDASVGVNAAGARVGGASATVARIMETVGGDVRGLIDTGMEQDAARLAALSVQSKLRETGLNITNTTMAATLRALQ